MIKIRHATEDDKDSIRHLTIEAFSDSPLGYHGEADLVDSLRLSCRHQLALVACIDGGVVGHVLFTQAFIHWDNKLSNGMGLAPLSVAPKHQGCGIGSQLVRCGMKQLYDSGEDFVIVLGHPEYYPQFGFRPGLEFGVRHGFGGIAQSSFFISWNPNKPIPQKNLTGRAYYDAEFGLQHAVTTA